MAIFDAYNEPRKIDGLGYPLHEIKPITRIY
jgi:hypothetical protein